MRVPLRLVVLALVAGVAFVPTVRGQDSARALPPRLSFSLGTSLAWCSHADVERALVRGGMNGFEPAGCSFGFCSPGIQYPHSYPGSLSASLSVRYLLTRNLEIRALYSNADLGSTWGHTWDSGGADIQVVQRAQTFAMLLAVRAPGGLRLVAGPSLNHVRVAEELRGGQTAVAVVPGAVVGAGLESSTRALVFIELEGEYRLIAPMRLGPWRVTSYGGTTWNALPETRPSFSYGLVTLGLGIRI